MYRVRIWLHIDIQFTPARFYLYQKRVVEKENKEEKTPLHLAAEEGHVA